MRVYKYGVMAERTFALELPSGAAFLSVQTQRGAPQAWFLVDEKKTGTTTRKFFTVGTGHDLPPGPSIFLGTFQLAADDLVFHLFEDCR